MAASKSMLESLLARVRQRATEPRPGQLQQPLPAQKAAALERSAGTAATSPPPAARVAAVTAVVEEEIEEYDDELIEILDDDDVSSDSEPPPSETTAPLELRASAPSVEMRRRAVPPSSRPNALSVPRAPAAPAPAPATSAPVAAARLRAEVVGRRPVPATAVVHSQAERPDPRSSSFLELLDASLDLGRG